jgi:hypothetical protein
VDVLACSYLARSAAVTHDGPVRLVDRGIPMLAVAVREGRDHHAATARAAELLAPYERDLAPAEAGELGVLLHDEDPQIGTARGLARVSRFVRPGRQ